MIAEILCIGTELTIGQVLNTNAQYLSSQLNALGISVYYHVAVGDNPGRMEASLTQALSRADIVITSGGLGPTADDLSKELVAAHFGLPMVEDETSMAALKARFATYNRPMTENNLKQACFAQGAIILPNPNGTAPGCIVEADGKAVIQLPGPPRELKPMFQASVIPYLSAKLQGVIASRYIRIFGMGESEVAHRLGQLIDNQGQVTIAPYCSLGEVQLRLTAQAQDEAQALSRIQPVAQTICDTLGPVVYAITDRAEDSLARHTLLALLKGGKTVAVAESLTGGMVTAALVDEPGASAVLLEGVVAYSNAAKTRILGVPEALIQAHGAVSQEVAAAMAQGIRLASGADFGLSTTGIAGPGGGSDEKPLGLTYVALASAQGTRVKRLTLGNDRQRVRTLAMLHALRLLLEAFEA